MLYAREGANISINYLPAEQGNAEETKRLAEGGLTGGGKCLLIPYDLEKRESVHEVVDRHVMEYGGLDILVNNASRKVRCQRLEDIDTDAVESAFILQMMALTKFALPHIPDGGNIINMASVVAIRGTSSLVDYASAKGAAVSFTRSLSKQLAKRGIRVNAVAYVPFHVSRKKRKETRKKRKPKNEERKKEKRKKGKKEKRKKGKKEKRKKGKKEKRKKKEKKDVD